MATPAVLTHPESLKRPAGPSEYAKHPVNTALSKKEKAALYTKMARIRHFEQRCIRIYQQGKIGASSTFTSAKKPSPPGPSPSSASTTT